MNSAARDGISLRETLNSKVLLGFFPVAPNRTFEQWQRNCAASSVLALILCLAGCSGPKTIVRYGSPYDGVFYTVETSHGQGAIADDFTSIYANVQIGSRTQREEILNGEYLDDTRVIWTSPDDVDLCMKGGYTTTFRNVTILSSGSVTRSLHNHLRETCGTK